ncbi:hypothetical protein SAMN05444000_106103 [Shimia gijangensis]|uniref:Uncharacterized protein n=1 Tax=Shimia gijangensis TaxID=1470563 RepID=A0A1M6HNR3_9RHOB|nr:hypothetical protein [Shimia gijangensis]SHJ23784.1 hypothetical protein SAMN05444000_106103 [Shimia gijangensis]
MGNKLRVFGALTMVGVLAAGCASTSYQAYVKPGTGVDRVNRDRAECDVEANRLFPSANFPQTYPYGTVGYYGGGWGGGIGVIHSTDVNAGMRNQHRNQCMRLRGYEPYVFPNCTTEQLAGRSYAPLTRSPSPSPNICAVTLEGGERALVDLSKPQQ